MRRRCSMCSCCLFSRILNCAKILNNAILCNSFFVNSVSSPRNSLNSHCSLSTGFSCVRTSNSALIDTSASGAPSHLNSAQSVEEWSGFVNWREIFPKPSWRSCASCTMVFKKGVCWGWRYDFRLNRIVGSLLLMVFSLPLGLWLAALDFERTMAISLLPRIL